MILRRLIKDKFSAVQVLDAAADRRLVARLEAFGAGTGLDPVGASLNGVQKARVGTRSFLAYGVATGLDRGNSTLSQPSTAAPELENADTGASKNQGL